MQKNLFTLLIALSSSILMLPGQDLRQAPYFNSNQHKLKTEAAERAKASVLAAFTVPEQFDKDAKMAYTKERLHIGQSVADVILETALFDDVLYPYLQRVHDKILAANPELAPTTILLTSEPVPNAFSVGDGTLVVYTGLMSELENEDQLAFVMCHELAHFTLNHATRQLVQEIERFQSKEFKAQLKKIQEAEFDQSELYESMYRNVQFRSRYHRRDLERQADSLAYHYYLKTAYSPIQAQRLLELFETIDKPKGDSLLQLEEHFGCLEHPFQQKWKDNGSGSIWGSAIEAQKESNKKLNDSLSTHPDAQARFRWIAEMARQMQPPEHPATVENYDQIKFLCALENVDAWFSRERYDKTIYTALLYQKDYPTCNYFRDICVLALNGLFVQSKNHNLSAVLSQTSPYYDAGYNGLLTLLNNLRLSELTSLEACTVENQPNPESEYGIYAAYCYAVGKENKEQAKFLQKKYLQLYPKGRFGEAMVEK